MHLGPFHIDLTVPTNPSITSTSHVTDDCSNDCTVDVQWSGASGSPFVLAQLGLIPSSDTGPTGANLDASGDPTSMGRAGISALEGQELGPLAVGGSGIAGYSIEWSHAPDTVPDQIIDTGGESTTSPCLADGDWWFHLRTADVAGNWSDAVHFGVLSIDTTAPTNPTTVESASHQVSVWSPDPTIEANWSGSTDNGGCGVAGYSVEWSTSPGTVPDSVIETTVESATSPPLSDSNSWWLHVRAIDAVGIPAPGAVHLGPFWIDGTAPEATMSFPNGGEHFLGLDEIQISFVATDQTSGVGNVRFDLSTDGGSTWPESIYDGTNPGSPFPWTVTDVTTDTARLRVTVTDAAGNETEDVSDGDFSILATSGADEIQPLPDHVSLLPAAPNPAGMMGTRIGFALPGEAHVRLDIFGVGGRRVANLLDARQPAGLHWVSWRGTDDSGRRLSPGIYLVRLRTLGAEEVEEVVLLR
ncbi:MAG: hypothetical protein R3E12_14225 [Candidatus Eisenbacteria bacterium]